ncbi:hypothetical protein F4808DRAFT_416008 [Astrocystis sublimbata]|nr:hypothetical protein F4808DRAFT_416008 [Astrocystis sublimbata]
MFRLMNVPRMIPAVKYHGQYAGDHSIPTFKAPFLPTRTSSSQNTGSQNTGSQNTGSETNELVRKQNTYTTYTNKYGEEMIFDWKPAPPGYTLVPIGNRYITRRCRDLAEERNQKIYAKYLSRTRRRPPIPAGLYVPRDIFIMVKSDYKEKEAAAMEKWMKKLDKEYPKIPPTHKVKIRRLCYSLDSDSTSKSKWAKTLEDIRRYVLSKYTAFDSLIKQEDSAQAISQAREKADKILSTWRGD